MQIRTLCFVFCGCVLLNFSVTCFGASIQPIDLQCENLVSPLGLDVARPTLKWRVSAINADQHGQAQSSYQICVASNPELLRLGKPDLWNSGETRSDKMLNIAYAGLPLAAGELCFWTVRSADENGDWSSWSDVARWSVGMLSQSDWHAKWIGSPDAVGRRLNSKPTENELADPWFRKSISLSERPTHAEISVASTGYHELYVNGEKIGNAVLSASATDHAKRARYVTYDIASRLRAGPNVIGIWLGTSWSIFPAYQTDDKPAAPIVLAQGKLQFQYSSAIEITTDESWKTHPSPNMLLGFWDAHGFAGEKYDARQEISNWCDNTADASSWNSVAVFTPALEISADKTEPNRLEKRINPVAVTEVSKNVFQIDFGIGFTGWVEVPVAGQPGERIDFLFSEKPDSTMTFGMHSAYIIGPLGNGVFRNHFNYTSGRWLTIAGLKTKPDIATIKARQIRTDYKPAGFFECDQPMLNRIYQMANWTFENLTLGSYLVDCPQRERRGYGDGFGSTRLAFDNYNMAAFYTKWAQDWCDVQKQDGEVPFTAPTQLGGGGPAWSGLCVSLPWETYRRYGDIRVLQNSFPTMQRWLAFLETKSKQNILQRYGGNWGFLGDWEWPQYWTERSRIQKQGKFLGDTPESLFFNNCNWIYDLQTAAKVADVLGDSKMAAAYRQRAGEIRSAVHHKFFNPVDSSYVNGNQAPLAIALLVDLPPDELRPAVWKRLEQEILVNRSGHIWAGIIGGGFLFETLLNENRNDLIFAMASKTDFPSWGNMIVRGATTFPEDWNLGGSQLHSSYLYIGGWFIEGLGGIKQSDCAYKHIVIDPWINQADGPKRVNVSYDSPYGKIVSRWAKEYQRLSIEVTIPPNTDAKLILRGTLKDSLTEGGMPVQSESEERATISLTSGHYFIAAKMQER